MLLCLCYGRILKKRRLCVGNFDHLPEFVWNLQFSQVEPLSHGAVNV